MARQAKLGIIGVSAGGQKCCRTKTVSNVLSHGKVTETFAGPNAMLSTSSGKEA
jgi:uncharacterized ferredoxin-like protein